MRSSNSTANNYPQVSRSEPDKDGNTLYTLYELGLDGKTRIAFASVIIDSQNHLTQVLSIDGVNGYYVCQESAYSASGRGDSLFFVADRDGNPVSIYDVNGTSIGGIKSGGHKSKIEVGGMPLPGLISIVDNADVQKLRLDGFNPTNVKGDNYTVIAGQGNGTGSNPYIVATAEPAWISSIGTGQNRYFQVAGEEVILENGNWSALSRNSTGYYEQEFTNGTLNSETPVKPDPRINAGISYIPPSSSLTFPNGPEANPALTAGEIAGIGVAAGAVAFAIGAAGAYAFRRLFGLGSQPATRRAGGAQVLSSGATADGNKDVVVELASIAQEDQMVANDAVAPNPLSNARPVVEIDFTRRVFSPHSPWGDSSDKDSKPSTAPVPNKSVVVVGNPVAEKGAGKGDGSR